MYAPPSSKEPLLFRRARVLLPLFVLLACIAVGVASAAATQERHSPKPRPVVLEPHHAALRHVRVDTRRLRIARHRAHVRRRDGERRQVRPRTSSAFPTSTAARARAAGSTAPASRVTSSPTSASRCRTTRSRSSTWGGGWAAPRCGLATSSSSTALDTSASTSGTTGSFTRRTPAPGCPSTGCPARTRAASPVPDA